MDSLRNTWWILPGYCIGLGGLALITYRTVRAVLSTSKSITLQVNSFGEQYLDLLCLVLLWMVSLIGMWILWSRMKEHSNTKDVQRDSPTKNQRRKPLDSFGTVSFSFSNELDNLPGFPFNESENEDASEAFFIEAQETNRDFSFTVQIVSPPDEE